MMNSRPADLQLALEPFIRGGHGAGDRNGAVSAYGRRQGLPGRPP